ncbi:MAG: mannitol dehydrogenase family protein [Ramlibacter sp.]|nr:mannitol dehydrogenase family protein [Ramlibacter sp.]
MTSSPNIILHIGLGCFHRAHQAAYLHALQESGDRTWGLVGGNIRGDTAVTMDALASQHGQYTLETVSPAGERVYQRICSIEEVIPFSRGLGRLIHIGAQPTTRIISFTVTEAGYFLTPANEVDTTHPDLRNDLENGTLCTIYSAITAILLERMRQASGPVTLLSCDNLRSNGARFRSGLLDFVTRRAEAGLCEWIKANTTCPSSMVDRITPRPTNDVAGRVFVATGWADRAPVMAEQFVQWVLEDQFIAGRPNWAKVGAEFVDSVHAHEEAKIRVLNATHSCLAWSGTLRGLSFIHEDVAVPSIQKIAYDYVTHDVIPSLVTPGHPSPLDLPRYRDIVFNRFSNPFVRDSNQRVAMDGFSKIPGFVLPTIRECIVANRSCAAVAMLPALFFVFLQRWNRGELPHPYEDAVMDPQAIRDIFAAEDPLAAFCRDRVLWCELAGDQALLAAMRHAHQRVEQFLQTPI